MSFEFAKRYWFSLILMILIGCGQRENAMSDCDFFRIPLPMNDENACSPQVPEDFRGIKISMPAKIDFPENGKIPIFGTIQVSGETDRRSGGGLKQQMSIVFVNKDTNQAFSFNIIPNKEPIKQDKSALIDSSLVSESDYTVNMYFSIDALYYYPDFPLATAEYRVYASALDIQSNVIETEITY